MRTIILIKLLVYIFFTIKIFFGSKCFASFEDLGVGARFKAMGETSATSVNNADAIFLNCSGLSQVMGLRLSFYYSNPFGIKNLTHASFSSCMPFSWGTTAVAMSTFGNQLYHENLFLFSYANNVRQKFYFGLSLRYFRLSISQYGSDSALGFDIGFIAVITPRFNWGFFSHNLNRSRISTKKETLPQIFCTGFSTNPAKDLLINFDLYKDVQFPLELRFGFEYTILHRLTLRSGFATEPARFTTGFGILFFLFNIDYAIATHSDLGVTHHFSINVILSQKKFHKKKSLKANKPIIIKKINLNSATSRDLQQLKGVGPTLANRIIQYRQRWGPFRNIEQLKKIQGIGEKLFEKIRPYITVK